MNLNKQTMNSRRPFTLIELLVVIAIIVERHDHDWSEMINGGGAYGLH
jgi:hypothetical protein